MKAACKNGHAYTPENTMWRALTDGRRVYTCRICGRRRSRAYRAWKRQVRQLLKRAA